MMDIKLFEVFLKRPKLTQSKNFENPKITYFVFGSY